ncbi:hypothetical protein SAMN05428986_3760 [Enterobacter ludwigii]|nr:hypothetical protein SAMN05428986_3760 [Enterobacter ludwigii]
MGISPTLNIPQARFLAMQHKFKAYVAGFGYETRNYHR